jgi:hypothetical protein
VVFQLYDIDEDGVITRDEILQIVRPMYNVADSTVASQQNEDTLENVWLSDLVLGPQFPILIVYSPRIVGGQGVYPHGSR